MKKKHTQKKPDERKIIYKTGFVSCELRPDTIYVYAVGTAIVFCFDILFCANFKHSK